MVGIFPCSISSTQELHGCRVPHIENPLLELIEIALAPTGIVAHEFCSLCELIAVETCSQSPVAVAADIFGGSCPLHQHLHGMFGASLVTFNLPSQSILIGNGGPTCGIDVVLP